MDFGGHESARVYSLHMKLFVTCFSFATLLLSNFLTADNWPTWRGPNENGSATGGTYPVQLTDEAKWEWRVALPGKGCSTPVVWEDHIVVTAPVDGQDALLAYDWKGKERWRTTFGKENAGRHRNGSGSNSSAVTDGQAF